MSFVLTCGGLKHAVLLLADSGRGNPDTIPTAARMWVTCLITDSFVFGTVERTAVRSYCERTHGAFSFVVER